MPELVKVVRKTVQQPLSLIIDLLFFPDGVLFLCIKMIFVTLE